MIDVEARSNTRRFCTVRADSTAATTSDSDKANCATTKLRRSRPAVGPSEDSCFGSVSKRKRSMAKDPVEPGMFVFFSYSHEDKRLRDQLEKHLTTFEAQGMDHNLA